MNSIEKKKSMNHLNSVYIEGVLIIEPDINEWGNLVCTIETHREFQLSQEKVEEKTEVDLLLQIDPNSLCLGKQYRFSGRLKKVDGKMYLVVVHANPLKKRVLKEFYEE